MIDKKKTMIKAHILAEALMKLPKDTEVGVIVLVDGVTNKPVQVDLISNAGNYGNTIYQFSVESYVMFYTTTTIFR